MKKLFAILLLFPFIYGLSVCKPLPKEPIRIKTIENNISPNKEISKIPEVNKFEKPVPKVGIEQKKETNLNSETIVGEIKFSNSHIMGRIGDGVAAERLTGMGFYKIRSKTTSIHGIDGVYLKKEKGKVKILIVENKVNSSQLSVNSKGHKQMSEAWIKEKVEEMIHNSNQRTRNTGELLKKHLENDPASIERQLWNYDFTTGKTEVWNLDKNAKIISTKPKWIWVKDKILIDKLKKIKNEGLI